MDKRGLHLLPLGGTGEIGMNLNLYHQAGRWLVVDCGVMFGRDGPHDQHALFPDISFAEARRHKIEGLVLTHAHQDHLGAVADLWPQLKCPVYATRFAAEMLRDPLREAGLEGKVPIRVLEERCRFELGPFSLQRIPLTHSTVEMGALVIRTPAGAVLHTGDFKLDPEPLVGRKTAVADLQALAREGLLAVVSDSTNADVNGWTPSEADAARGLAEVLRGCEGRVAVTLFSSNVARMRTVIEAADALGRSAVLLGRSVERTVAAARQAGYLGDLPALVPARELGFLPRAAALIVCTGSQGEPRSALARVAEGKHRDVYLESGDTVVFSSRQIPGNELFIERMVTMLRASGVRIVTADDAPVHCSGHPCRDELRQLYRWIRPRTVVPVHGTPTKLEAHAQLAEELGLGAARIRNGDILRLGPGEPQVERTIRTGRIRRKEPKRSERPRRRREPRRR